MNWKPALRPEWRSPRGGWVISEIPGDAPDAVKRGWVNRRHRANKNGHQAVQEMVEFLQHNRVQIDKDLLTLIQQQADSEWCGKEPTRCSKTARSNALVKQASDADVKTVTRAVSASAGVVIRRRRKCCGG